MNTFAEIENQVLGFSLEEQMQLLALLADNIRNKATVKPRDEKTFRRKLGGFEGKIRISPDFDETPDCFAEYV